MMHLLEYFAANLQALGMNPTHNYNRIEGDLPKKTNPTDIISICGIWFLRQITPSIVRLRSDQRQGLTIQLNGNQLAWLVKYKYT